MSKGNREEFIFSDDKDKDYFIELLGRCAQRFNIEVYAYCVMGNHYHLLIRTLECNLHELMHYLGSSYASYCARNKCKGHIFHGRYKSICVDEEEYLLILSRYIHLNPVEAGITERPEEYPWSSYVYFVEDRTAPSWLSRNWLVEYFGPGASSSKKRYREFVMEKNGETNEYPHEEVVAQSILGDSDFVEKIISSCDKNLRSEEASNRRALLKRVTLEQVYRVICKHYGLKDLRDKESALSEKERKARKLYVYLAKEYTPSANKEIGEKIGGASPYVVSNQYRRIRKKLKENAEFKKMFLFEVEELNKHINLEHDVRKTL